LTLGVTTVMQGLYQKALKLAWPDSPSKDGEYVLIYGGSTATGALGIQFAKLSVFQPLLLPRNAHDVKLRLQSSDNLLTPKLRICQIAWRPRSLRLQRQLIHHQNPRIDQQQTHQNLGHRFRRRFCEILRRLFRRQWRQAYLRHHSPSAIPAQRCRKYRNDHVHHLWREV
jgi:hypothetical protein